MAISVVAPFNPGLFRYPLNFSCLGILVRLEIAR